MKIFLFFILFVAPLLWQSSSQAAGELGENNGVNSNPHNFSSQSQNIKKAKSLGPFPLPPGGFTPIDRVDTQICIFCHTPHGATPQTTLWNRPKPMGPIGGFPTFASSSVQDPSGILGIADTNIVGTTLYGNTTAPNEYPNGASKLCLSCHDGVTAIGILANSGEIEMKDGNDKALMINLEVSHPISFVYNSTVQFELNKLGKTDAYKWPTTAYLDGASRVQCTICHQPHQDTKNASYILPFWRGAGTNDVIEYNDICNACHTTTYNNLTFPDHQYP
ncbi:MAG: hypothetical protein Q7U74_13415 [Saprospiraceae bacterium]|nr:hypothetical protein [Saprospiraceae bacterium]